MSWQLQVRFQEMELRDAYWEQVTAMPQLANLLQHCGLRTRQYLNRPVVVLECDVRDTLAALARFTLDYWQSAQISLHQGGRTIESLDEGADVYLETDAPASIPVDWDAPLI